MPRIAGKADPKARLKRVLLGCGIGCGTGLVLLLVAAAVLYYQVTARPPAPPPTASQPGAAAAGPALAPPPPVEAQVEAVKQAVAANQPTPVSLRFTEAQLNELFSGSAGPDSPVRNPHVSIGSGQLTITGTTMWNGRELYLTAEAAPRAENGRLAVRVYSARVGRLSVPASAVTRIEAEINRSLAEGGPFGSEVQVADAKVANGELQITGQTVPR